MRLALIGDIHFYRLWIAPWRLLGKTMLGQTNLWMRRRHHFNPTLLAPTLAAVEATKPDLLLCSGDLTTTAQPGEFTDVKRIMADTMSRIPTVIVPGNHDRYSFSATRSRLMERMMGDVVPSVFPMTRKLNDRWWLLALNSCVPRVWSSQGALGRAQLDAASKFLSERSAGEGVVVLCHYPFAVPPSRPAMKAHHVLADAEALREILMGCAARVLMMHGHVHRPWCWDVRSGEAVGPEELSGEKVERIEGKRGGGGVTVINAGSPTLVGPAHPQGQGFWVIDLPETGTRPEIRHESPKIGTTAGYRADML